MRYTVTKQRIDILGRIWWPMGALCAQFRDLSDYDLSNIEDVTDRDSVEHWVCLHSGDFSEIVDFRADFHINGKYIVHEWKRGEESEMEFAGCFSQGDD